MINLYKFQNCVVIDCTVMKRNVYFNFEQVSFFFLLFFSFCFYLRRVSGIIRTNLQYYQGLQIDTACH
jgi:hypothetical protein